jgi:hypothetical protein
MKIVRFTMLAIVAVTAGCQTMAESNYELNRRSGLGLEADKGQPADSVLNKDMAALRTSRMPARAPHMPVRLPPIVEKVWVYDQIINDGQWLQGTWLFVEVEGPRWLSEIDSGSGSFLDSGKVGIKKSSK